MMRNLIAKEHQLEHEQSTSDVQRRGILYKDWMFVDCLDAYGQLLPSVDVFWGILGPPAPTQHPYARLQRTLPLAAQCSCGHHPL
jgi:hypothetical protein